MQEFRPCYSAKPDAFRWGFRSDVPAYAFVRPCCSTLQRCVIFSIIESFLRIIFLFLHFFLFSLLQMYERGDFVTDTHMWSVVVLEVDVSADDVPGMPDVVEVTLSVDTFALDCPVDPFGDGIVRRFVVLRHADGNLVRL